jgi:hypothetical protein
VNIDLFVEAAHSVDEEPDAHKHVQVCRVVNHKLYVELRQLSALLPKVDTAQLFHDCLSFSLVIWKTNQVT